MFHTVAFTASNAAAAVNADTPALNDGTIPIQNNHFLPQNDMKLLLAVGLGAALTDARLNTPHFRMVGFPHIWPVDVAALPTSVPAISAWDEPYITIPKLDELAAELSNSAGAPEREFLLLWLQDMYMPPAMGDRYALKFTATITATANVWTRGNITFESSLPSGRYQVQGLDVFGTTLVAARLRYTQYTLSPGTLGRATMATKPNPIFRQGRLGSWGEFDNTAQPQLEILCTAADTAQTGVLDVVKIR
jgi:hypothetical protein